MSPEDEQELLKRTAQIERRIVWIAHTLIGAISVAVYEFVRHNEAAQAYWQLSDERMSWVGLAAAGLLFVCLKAGFNRS